MEAENENEGSVAHTEPADGQTETIQTESESFMVAEQTGPAANQPTHQDPGETTEAGLHVFARLPVLVVIRGY